MVPPYGLRVDIAFILFGVDVVLTKVNLYWLD